MKNEHLKIIASGGLAGGLSFIMLALRGRQEHGSALAPINAPSHWVHGKEALSQEGASWRYTGLGTAIHHASALMWAFMFSKLIHGRHIEQSPGRLMASAAAMTGAAAVVDFKLVPERLTPGFEHHLSRKSLVMIYGAFALGLALGNWPRQASSSKAEGRGNSYGAR